AGPAFVRTREGAEFGEAKAQRNIRQTHVSFDKKSTRTIDASAVEHAEIRSAEIRKISLELTRGHAQLTRDHGDGRSALAQVVLDGRLGETDQRRRVGERGHE